MEVLILLVIGSFSVAYLMRALKDIVRARKGEYHVFTYQWERGEEAPTHSVIITDDQGEVVRVTEAGQTKSESDDLIQERMPA